MRKTEKSITYRIQTLSSRDRSRDRVDEARIEDECVDKAEEDNTTAVHVPVENLKLIKHIILSYIK